MCYNRHGSGDLIIRWFLLDSNLAWPVLVTMLDWLDKVIPNGLKFSRQSLDWARMSLNENLNGDGWETRWFKATISSQESPIRMMFERIEANNCVGKGFVTLRC